MKPRFFQLLCVLAFSLIWIHCPGGGGLKQPKYAATVTQDMRSTFATAERQYREQSYDQAVASYQNYIQTYPYNALTDESYYKIAKIHFLKKKFDLSIQNFTNIIRKSPDPAYVAKAGHYAGYAAYMNADTGGAYDFLKDVKPSALPLKLRLQFFSLAVKLGEKDAKFQSFSEYSLLRLYDTYEEVAVNLRDFAGQDVLSYSVAKDRVLAWSVAPFQVADIESWMKSYPVSPAKEILDFKIAKAYFHEKPESKATANTLNAFLKNYPRSEYANDVKKMLDQIGVEAAVVEEKPFKVGVITLSGEGAIYGTAIKQGAQCAAGEAGACGEQTRIEILYADSGTDEAGLRQAFEGLLTQNVAAIIALVPGALNLEAATLAAEKRVPLFLISQKSGVMKQGESVFQMGLVPEQQIEDLVATALQKGLKRVAIYSPDIEYGQLMSKLFAKEMSDNGGKVVAQVTYKKNSPDPYEPAEKLKSALDLQEGAGKKKIDALFVPDSYTRFDTLISGLQLYNLTGFPILGTNAINDPKLTPKLASLYPGSFFIDVYNPREDSEVMTHFQQQFSQTFGKKPIILNAMAYDAMMMIRSAVNQAGVHRLQNTLTDRFGYHGVTGIRGFETGKAPIVQTSVIPVRDHGDE